MTVETGIIYTKNIVKMMQVCNLKESKYALICTNDFNICLLFFDICLNVILCLIIVFEKYNNCILTVFDVLVYHLFY